MYIAHSMVSYMPGCAVYHYRIMECCTYTHNHMKLRLCDTEMS